MNRPTTTTVQPSDADLLRLAAAGDRTAFAELYDRFCRPLYSLAFRITGNSTEAEDLVQEVFVELWSKASVFDPSRAQPFTWAVSIIRHKAIDRLRAGIRRGAILERAAPDIAALSSGSGSFPGTSWDADSAALVRAAFQDLPEDQRAVIELAYFEGLSQTQIAEHLSQPLGTIKARIRRGLIRLRDRLAGRL